jgi:hypothetical protein
MFACYEAMFFITVYDFIGKLHAWSFMADSRQNKNVSLFECILSCNVSTSLKHVRKPQKRT